MRVYLVLVFILVLAACQPQEPTLVLPTQLDLDVISTATAQAAVAQTMTAEFLRPPTLPSTWTPSPVVAATPVPEVTRPANPATDAAAGMIYYIYNGDAIARVPADNSGDPELTVLANGIDDLTLSPDGTLLAYVAQGSGSAREVYITSLDGTYNQQISCLGFSRVLQPTWSWDNSALAFLAAQTSDGPMDIYVADITGSNNCPSGNNQRQLTELASQRLDGLTWNADGTRIYFGNYNISAVELSTRNVFDVTLARGFGADQRPLFNPQDGFVYFLRPAELDRDGGQLFAQDPAQLIAGEEPPDPTGIFGYYADYMRFSMTTDNLVMSGSDGSIFIVDLTTGSPIPVAESLVGLPPQPVLSPDTAYVAYIALGAVAPQIYVIPRVGGDAVVITEHTEGTVQDLAWASN